MRVGEGLVRVGLVHYLGHGDRMHRSLPRVLASFQNPSRYMS